MRYWFKFVEMKLQKKLEMLEIAIENTNVNTEIIRNMEKSRFIFNVKVKIKTKKKNLNKSLSLVSLTRFVLIFEFIYTLFFAIKKKLSSDSISWK